MSLKRSIDRLFRECNGKAYREGTGDFDELRYGEGIMRLGAKATLPNENVTADVLGVFEDVVKDLGGEIVEDPHTVGSNATSFVYRIKPLV